MVLLVLRHILVQHRVIRQVRLKLAGRRSCTANIMLRLHDHIIEGLITAP